MISRARNHVRQENFYQPMIQVTKHAIGRQLTSAHVVYMDEIWSKNEFKESHRCSWAEERLDKVHRQELLLDSSRLC